MADLLASISLHALIVFLQGGNLALRRQLPAADLGAVVVHFKQRRVEEVRGLGPRAQDRRPAGPFVIRALAVLDLVVIDLQSLLLVLLLSDVAEDQAAQLETDWDEIQD